MEQKRGRRLPEPWPILILRTEIAMVLSNGHMGEAQELGLLIQVRQYLWAAGSKVRGNGLEIKHRWYVFVGITSVPDSFVLVLFLLFRAGTSFHMFVKCPAHLLELYN